MVEPNDQALADALRERLTDPISTELFAACRLAIALTHADLAHRTVDIDGGPSLPAGDLVELLNLDSLLASGSCP